MFTLAAQFPVERALWQNVNFRKAFPASFRIALRRRFGAILPLADRHRRHTASRNGVFSRPFESGDTLGTLSRSHLLKRDELVVRSDYADGRKRALVLLHGYENMLFGAETHLPNKGQVALACAGLIYSIHENLQQDCQVRLVFDDDLSIPLRHFVHKRSKDDIYIISDFLQDPSLGIESGGKLIRALGECGVRSACLVVVRDPLEWPKDNPLQQDNSLLHSFQGSFRHQKPLHSGEGYASNLALHLNELAESCATRHYSLFGLTGRSSPSEVVHEVIRYIHQSGRVS